MCKIVYYTIHNKSLSDTEIALGIPITLICPSFENILYKNLTNNNKFQPRNKSEINYYCAGIDFKCVYYNIIKL